jgi:hypothetical protein
MNTHTGVAPHDLPGFLVGTDLIAHAAERLRHDRRDQFAVSLLLRFEELDAAHHGPVPGAQASALRDSLRRVARRLLEHHAGGGEDALLAELATLHALVGPQNTLIANPPRTGRTRLLPAVGAFAVGALVGIGSILPGTRAAKDDLRDAEAAIEKLEDRVAQVANEKALEQDEKEYATAAAQEIAEIAVYAAEINADLELCIEYGDQAIDIALGIAQGYTYNSREVDRFVDNWSRACEQARQKSAELRAYLESP